jgi:hypothetical protein
MEVKSQPATTKVQGVPNCTSPQVEQVVQSVSTVAGAGSFLPMPEEDREVYEYLATHPSHEHRCETFLLQVLC